MNENNQIVIVGAGLGGLAFAANLSREGFPVLLIEKYDKSGGFFK